MAFAYFATVFPKPSRKFLGSKVHVVALKKNDSDFGLLIPE